jgi:hypothetical protein
MIENATVSAVATAPVTVTAAVVIGCGALIGLAAVVLLFAWLRTETVGTGEVSPDDNAANLADTRTNSVPDRARRAWRWWALAVVAAALGWLVTGWPVAGLAAAGCAWYMVHAIMVARAERERLARVDAIAVWVSQLADTVRETGLQQALIATSKLAPDAIAGPVGQLAASLSSGNEPQDALIRCGQELEDPTADVVIAALVMASAGPATGLADLLTELRTVARAEADLHRGTHAERAPVRTAVKVVLISPIATLIVIGFVLPGFLTAYQSWNGQIVLMVVATGYALLLLWMTRLARLPVPPRIITRAAATLVSEPRPMGWPR